MRRITKLLTSTVWHIEYGIALGIVAGLIMTAQGAYAARNNEYPGSDVQVHYVHLTGHAGDNAVHRSILSAEHGACALALEVRGQSARALAPDAIPQIVYPQDIEIYYASNRILTVSKGVVYSIDPATCALTSKSRPILRLRSAAGLCEIDLNAKEARGVCDETAHERAPNSTFQHMAPTQAPAIDLNKVPPQVRAQVAAQIERLKQLPKGAGGQNAAALLPTGGYKTIAGYKCKSYRADALLNEVCIAHPPSPFPIPAAPLNGGIPGLLLDMDSPSLTLHAQEVRMGISVSRDMFAIPKGMKVTNIRVQVEKAIP